MRIITEVTFADIAYEFLKAEWYKPHFDTVRTQYDNIVKYADLNNPQHLKIVMDLITQLRGFLLMHLPDDTKWFIVEFEGEDFDNLLHIHETGWEQTFGINKTIKDVASQVNNGNIINWPGFNHINSIKNSIGQHPFEEKLILISESHDGPFTLLDGNHRAVAFASKALETNQRNHLPQKAYLGTSANMSNCTWLSTI